MRTRDFYFNLPAELIAQEPLRRGDSRLLVYSRKTQELHHDHVSSLPNYLDSDTLIVVNNALVRKARVYGRACGKSTLDSSSRTEFIFIQALNDSLQSLKPGLPGIFWRTMVGRHESRVQSYSLPGGLKAEIIDREAMFFIVSLNRSIGEDYFEQHGHVPLPPYIRREDRQDDAERYQTVFASQPGSIAAPTAALHFDASLLSALEHQGIELCEITLHVGPGTFLPVRSDDIYKHHMHSEDYEISVESAHRISEHKKRGRPILAVGTTSLRCLESAWNAEQHCIIPGRSQTDLFIYPGYKFKLIDSLFTNFHTPQSTLTMLVSALVGREILLSLYEEAIRKKYRFFSYGDAMLFL